MPKPLNLDIELIKKLLNEHGTVLGVARILKCNDESVRKIIKLHNIFFTKKPKKHSLETKEKLSIFRKNFLKNNPDKHPWRNKDKFKSIPCNKLKEWLKSKNIEFIEEYIIPESTHNYSIDIAFPDKKIGLEVNGNQHYNNDGTLKEYYQNRHNYLESLDWKIYELHYSLCFKIQEIENLIPNILTSPIKYNFDYKIYIKPNKKKIKKLEKQINGTPTSNLTTNYPLEADRDIHFHHKGNKISLCKCGKAKHNKAKQCSNCNYFSQRKITRPSREELEKLIFEYPILKLAEKFNISDAAIHKWCKSYDIIKPPIGYWRKRELGYSHEESLLSYKRPLKNHKNKLNLLIANEIRNLIKLDNLSLREIGKKFGIHHNTVIAIRDNKIYKN